jgi:hypothetical protein
MLIGSVVLGFVVMAVAVLSGVRMVRGRARWMALIRRWRTVPARFVQHRRDVRALRHQRGVPIERVAADLRRLRRLVRNDEHSSAAHQLGNRLAYDRLLMQACAMLDIEHELERQSSGIERDIERLRIEAELERAGVVLSDRDYGQAA